MTITVAFTLGAAVAGFVTAWVMPALGWRAVFTLGGSIPLVVGILMIFWLPESLQFSVVHKKFDKIGRWVRSVDPSASIGPGTEYVVGEQASRGVPLKQLFSDGRAIVTLLYWTVNFTNLLNLYFLAGLLPRILSNPEGPNFSTSTSALIGSMMQVGGTIGTFGLAWLIAKKGFTPILTLSFAVASVAIALMGSQTVLGAVPLLTIIVFVAGWAVIGGQPGLNALAATYYPTSMRSTGIGWDWESDVSVQSLAPMSGDAYSISRSNSYSWSCRSRGDFDPGDAVVALRHGATDTCDLRRKACVFVVASN